MANRTYLVVSNNDTVYPSYVEPEFEPADSTVAQAPYCIPLLWMGLFRDENMQMQHIDGEMGSLRMLAPVVELTTALRQLREAVPVLEGLFSGGTLNEFYDMLAATLLTTERKYVTIELEELAYMFSPRVFFGDLHTALRALEGGSMFDKGKQQLLEIAQLHGLTTPTPVPSARSVIDGEYTQQELTLHSGIIGCQWLRHVHWERDLCIPVEARVNPSMDMIYAALFEILCCVMSADGKIATSEKRQLTTILSKVGVPWSLEEIGQRVEAFVERAQEKSYAKVLEEALSNVPTFKRIGRESVLTRCIDIIIEADGIVEQREKELCERIKGILHFADR